MQLTSIRAKLLVSFLTFFIGSFFVLSGVSYYISQQALTKSVNEVAMSVGKDYAKQINYEINDIVVRLEGLAALERIREGSDKQAIIAALAEGKKRLDKLGTGLFISLDGSAVRFDGSTGQLGDRDYFKQVLATSKPVVSEMLISQGTGKVSVNIAVPVMNNGRVTGVVTGPFPLELLTEIVKEVKFLETGYGLVADDSGLILAHPRAPELIGKLNLKEKKVNPELKLAAAELDDRLVECFKISAEQEKQVRGQYTFVDGIKRVAVFTPINIPGGQRWVMMVTAPAVEAERETSTLMWTMLIISLVCVVIASVFVIFMSKKFAKPIAVIRDECMLLTEGDLQERNFAVTSQDEIGQLAHGFRDMRTNLRMLVTSVLSQSQQLAASSEELTASAQQSAQAANQVAGSITEIAAGSVRQAAAADYLTQVADELAKQTGQISATALEVSEIAESTSQEAQQGRLAVNQTIEQMNKIGKGSIQIQTAIAELSQGSNEINEIVNLISTIAGQTNLLALNAAIEAARAGEHGRGFAVVAEEVRKLAEQSNQAAQQIGTLIKHNQINMEQAVIATQAGAEGIKTGVETVNDTGKVFTKIVESIFQLTIQIKEISNAMNKMAAGNKTLVASIQEIDKVSKENAAESEMVSAATEEQSASMQEIASSSHSLAKLAGELQESVAKFKV